MGDRKAGGLLGSVESKKYRNKYRAIFKKAKAESREYWPRSFDPEIGKVVKIQNIPRTIVNIDEDNV